jgi:tRNA pseudouridine65 synthase
VLSGEARVAEHRVSGTPVFDVLYEDGDLVAIGKPSGAIVHRGWASDGVPLLQAVRDRVGVYVHPVHRLDRATSGVLLFAKDAETARALGDQFSGRSVEKVYLALTRGSDPELGRVDHPLESGASRERKKAVTDFRFLGASGRYGLYEAQPLTGRLHQIRRHLKHVSHPIIGDVRYGKGEHNRLFRESYDFHRLALHARRLRFRHPRTSEELTIEAPLPQDFFTLLARLGLDALL